jgi:hypothetical protein
MRSLVAAYTRETAQWPAHTHARMKARPSPGQLCRDHGMVASRTTISRMKFKPGHRNEKNKLYTCTKCPLGTGHKGEKMENPLDYVRNELAAATEGESSQCNRKRIKNVLKLLNDALDTAPLESLHMPKNGKILDDIFETFDGLVPFLDSIVEFKDLARVANDLWRVYRATCV